MERSELLNHNLPYCLWLALFAIGRRLRGRPASLQRHRRCENVILLFDCVCDDLNECRYCRSRLSLISTAQLRILGDQLFKMEERFGGSCNLSFLLITPTTLSRDVVRTQA
jgi:hypothetical protein